MANLKIKIIIGSTREGRFGEKPARWMLDKIQKRKEIDAELLDLRDYPMPFFNEAKTPTAKKEPYGDEAVKRWTKKIAEADGFIVVAPEYNHGYPAVLKNALDYVYTEWNKKPVGFVSYGGAGGVRSVEQLRQVAVELDMVPLRTAIHIFSFWELLDEKGNLKENAFALFEGKANKLVDELLWFGALLRNGRM